MVQNMTSFFSRAASAYQTVGLESQVVASSAHELVSLLYEGFLERVHLAKLSIQSGKIETKIKNVQQALQILTDGLRANLDLKSGGDLAQNLDRLYQYCSLRLVEANAKNDITVLDEVYGLIQPLADAWKQNRVYVTENSQTTKISVSGFRAASDGSSAIKNRVFSTIAGYGNPMLAGV
jgi:flagellar protein FliS